MDVEKSIREYLPQVIHLSLATVHGDQPWLSEVHFVYDDALNFYFLSGKHRRHSQEIQENPKVAGSIVKQHSLGEEGQGVFFEGRAEVLEGVDEQHIAFKLYARRFGVGREVLADFHEETGHRFYKITVSCFSFFDGYQSGPNKKFELNWENK